MGFELQGSYVWDFWIARDDHEYHLVLPDGTKDR